MEKVELIEKLMNKANISYEEARNALENNNWDILDAMLYLEDCGKVKKPDMDVFYTNEYRENYSGQMELVKVSDSRNEEKENWEEKRGFHGIFEIICRVIDTCNNIFLKIERRGNSILKLPVTVLALLLFFAFWFIIPALIIGLLFDIKYIVISKKVNTDEVNKVLDEVYKNIQFIKEKFKKGFK